VCPGTIPPGSPVTSPVTIQKWKGSFSWACDFCNVESRVMRDAHPDIDGFRCDDSGKPQRHSLRALLAPPVDVFEQRFRFYVEVRCVCVRVYYRCCGLILRSDFNARLAANICWDRLCKITRFARGVVSFVERNICCLCRVFTDNNPRKRL